MTSLKIPPHEAIRMLEERLEVMTELGRRGCDLGYYDLLAWCSKTWSAVDTIFGPEDYRTEEIRQIGIPACACSKQGGVPMQMEICTAQLRKYIADIQAGMPDKES